MLNPISLGEKTSLPLVSKTTKTIVPVDKNITLLNANSVLRPAANNIGLIIVGIFSVLALLYALLRYLLNSWARPNYPKDIFLNPSLPKELILLRQNAKLHEKIEGVNRQHGLTLNPFSLFPSYSMNNEPQIEVMDMKGGSWRFPLTEPDDHELINLHKQYFDQFAGTSKPRTLDDQTSALTPDALRHENRRLRNSLEDTNSQLRELRGRLSGNPLHRRLDELIKINAQLQKKIEGLQTENNELQQRLSDAEAEISRLSQEKNQLLDEVEDNEETIEELEDSNERLQQALDDAESEVELLEERLRARDKDIERLSKKERRLVDLLKKADADLRDKDADIAALENELAAVEEELEYVTADREDILDELAEANSSIDGLEQTIESQNEEIAELKADNDNKDQIIQHLVEQLRALQEQQEKALEKPGPAVDIEGEGALPGGPDQTEALQKQIQDLQREHLSHVAELEEANRESDDASKELIRTLESQVEDLQKRLADQEGEISEKNERLKADSQRMDKLEAEIQQLREQLDKARANSGPADAIEGVPPFPVNVPDQSEALHQQLRELQSELDTERERREAVETQNKTLEERATAAEEDARTKQKTIDEQEEQIRELRESEAEAQRRADDLQAQLTKEKEAKERAEKQAAALQAQNTELQASNSSTATALARFTESEAQTQSTAAALASANKALSKKLSEAEALARLKEQEAQEKQKLLDEQGRELSQLREKETEASRRVSELEAQLANEKAATEKAEALARALLAQNAELESQLKKLTDSEAEAQRKAGSLENDNRALSQRVSDAESTAQAKAAENSDLQQQLEKERQAVLLLQAQIQRDSELANQLAAAKKQIETLLARIKELEAGGSGSGDDAQELRRQLTLLAQQMATLQAEYTSDRQQWDELQSALEETIKSLRSQLEQTPASGPSSPVASPKHAAVATSDASTQVADDELMKGRWVGEGQYKEWVNERLRFTQTETALNTANAALEGLRAEKQTLTDQCQSLTQRLQDATAAIRSNQENVEKWKDESETAKALVKQHYEEAEEYLRQKTKVEKELSQLKQKMARAEDALSAAPSAAGRRTPPKSSFSSAQAGEEIDDAPAAQPQKASPTLAAKSLGTGISEALTAANEEREKLESAFEVERDKWRGEFAKLHQRIAELEDENAELTKAKQQYTEELEKDREVQDGINARGEERILELQERIDDLIAKNKLLEEGAGSAVAPGHQRAKTLGGKDKPTVVETVNLGFENQKLRGELQAAKKVFSENATQIASLIQENNQLRDALRDALRQAGYSIPESGVESASGGAGSSSVSALAPSPAPAGPADKDSDQE
ncbi:MAG TPA: hypothetical protein VLG44_04630 [Chlamydiales bacterium]|nr:hypothetical protein [Chlamydiales bacterium]